MRQNDNRESQTDDAMNEILKQPRGAEKPVGGRMAVLSRRKLIARLICLSLRASRLTPLALPTAVEPVYKTGVVELAQVMHIP